MPFLQERKPRQSSSLLSQLQAEDQESDVRAGGFSVANMDAVWHWACAQLQNGSYICTGVVKVYCLSFSVRRYKKNWKNLELIYFSLYYLLLLRYIRYTPGRSQLFWILKLVMHPIDITYLREKDTVKTGEPNPYYPDGKGQTGSMRGNLRPHFGYRSSPECSQLSSRS